MRYAKALAQVGTTVLVALLPYLVAGGLGPADWVNVAIVGVGALAVFTGPNVPHAPLTKLALSAAAALLVALQSVISDGVSTAEWVQIAIAVLGALGVFAVPNAGAAADELGRQRTGFGRTDSDLV